MHRVAVRRNAYVAAVSSVCLATALAAAPARAQTFNPAVSVCTGASLPPSLLTDALDPLVTGLASPIETTVNDLIGVTALLPGIPLLPSLDIDVAGILADVAAGEEITLQVLDSQGDIVAPSDECNVVGDSFTLDDEAGIAIGGNRITGLGANGATASAADIDAIAFGNRASAQAGATASIALGADSRVSAANSVALGAGSVADRGAQLDYDAVGLDAPQSSAGEVSIGSAGSPRQLTHVAPGSADTDAVNVAQLEGVSGRLDARITTVADDLLMLDDRVTVNTTALAGLDERVTTNTDELAALSEVAVRYDDASRARVTLGGADGTILANVADGEVSASSTEAVNGSQLFETNQAVADLDDRVAGNETDITEIDARVEIVENGIGDNRLAIVDLDARVTHNTESIAALEASARPVRYVSPGDPSVESEEPTNHAALFGSGDGPVTLSNVAAGEVSATSNQAVNGAQLHATNQQVAANSADIAGNRDSIETIRNNLRGSTVSPVQYSDADDPTRSNGGTITNDATLVGADPGAPVGLHNVAPGEVAAGSTDAVNGGQLYATDQTAQTALATAEDAYELGANSVQYDSGGNSVTLRPSGPPAALRNVAAGTSATDAVNLGQLRAGMGAVLGEANAYTDSRIAGLRYSIADVRDDAEAGTASALAAAALPQAIRPGASMLALAGGYFGDEAAMALGFSTTFSDGDGIMRLGGTIDSRGQGGASAGVGLQF